jgi:hypothetical protein
MILLLNHPGMAQISGLVRTLCVPQRPRKMGKGLLQRENISKPSTIL